MLIKIIRIIILLFTIGVTAMVLPRLYHTAFSSGSSNGYKKVAYSEILQDFIITEYVYHPVTSASSGEIIHHNRQGKIYSEEEISDLLILDNVSQLAYEGRFPDTICGIAVTPDQVSAASFNMYYSSSPGIYYGLCELRDQKTYTTRKLEPTDLFRFSEKGIEFIDCETNRIDSAKSRLFNNCLQQAGFQPPALHMWTPSGKTESEALGYYLIDHKTDLYNLSMDNTIPVVRPLPKPEGKNIRNITFSATEDFIALLITEDGMTYLQLPDFTYRKLALPGALGKSILLSGNLFYRMFTYPAENAESTYVFDREYRAVDSITLIYPPQPEKVSHILSDILFPVSVGQSAWYGFYADWSPWYRFLGFNLFLLILAVYYKYRNGYSLRNFFTLTDLLLTGIFGLYGLLAMFIFPLKKSQEEMLKSLK